MEGRGHWQHPVGGARHADTARQLGGYFGAEVVVMSVMSVKERVPLVPPVKSERFPITKLHICGSFQRNGWRRDFNGTDNYFSFNFEGLNVVSSWN